MPLQLYDKAQILDACLAVFARHGYEKTSTGMLAEAAGISRTLIFHHFKSKKELYLALLDSCFEQAKRFVDVDELFLSHDFFRAREQLSLMKLAFKRKHPNVYKVMKEAFFATPLELSAEIEARSEAFTAFKHNLWRQLFEHVPLKEGVDRDQAFELIVVIMDYFDEKYSSSRAEHDELDDSYAQTFLDERNRFLSLIRYGIER